MVKYYNHIDLVPAPKEKPVKKLKKKIKSKKKYFYPVTYIFCSDCECYIQKRIKAQHERSMKHIRHNLNYGRYN